MLFGTLLLCIDDDGRLRGWPKRVFATIYALNWVLMGLAALLIDHPRAPTLFAVIADADLAIALFDGPWWGVSILVGDFFAIIVLVTEAIREDSSRMRCIRWVAAVAAVGMTVWGTWEFVLPMAVADAAIAQILQSVVSALFEPIIATIIVTAARRRPARPIDLSQDPSDSELVPTD
jgi:hypothetical protein